MRSGPSLSCAPLVSCTTPVSVCAPDRVALSCGTTAQTCAPDRLAIDGQPCGPLPDGTYAYCPGKGICTKVRSCVAGPREGAPCDPLFGPPCAAPAACVIDTCRLVDPAACE